MNTTSRMSAPRPPMIQRRRAPAVLMTCAVLAVISPSTSDVRLLCIYSLLSDVCATEPNSPCWAGIIPVCSARARQPGPDGPAVTEWLARVALASGDRDDLGAEQAPATDVQEA